MYSYWYLHVWLQNDYALTAFISFGLFFEVICVENGDVTVCCLLHQSYFLRWYVIDHTHVLIRKVTSCVTTQHIISIFFRKLNTICRRKELFPGCLELCKTSLDRWKSEQQDVWLQIVVCISISKDVLIALYWIYKAQCIVCFNLCFVAFGCF